MTRLKYYQTRAGARIAMRVRNHNLGFVTRKDRLDNEAFEYELCLTQDNLELTGAYCILEDTIDMASDQLLLDKNNTVDKHTSNSSNDTNSSSDKPAAA
jgi:hypothetical protein